MTLSYLRLLGVYVGCMVAYTATGQLLWQQAYPSTSFQAMTIQPLGGNTFNMVGIHEGKMTSVALDQARNLQFHNSFILPLPFVPQGVFTSDDKRYLIFSQQEQTVTVASINLLGGVRWQHQFSTTAHFSCIAAYSSGYFLAGERDDDMYVAAFLADGALLWERAFGGKGKDKILTINALNDGGCIMGGYTDLYDSGETDMLLMQMDSTGKNVWEKVFGEPQHQEQLCAVLPLPDGGFALVGSVETSFWLLRLTADHTVTLNEKLQLEGATLQPTACYFVNTPSLLISGQATTDKSPPHLFLLEYGL